MSKGEFESLSKGYSVVSIIILIILKTKRSHREVTVQVYMCKNYRSVSLGSSCLARVSSPAQLQEHNSHWAQDTDSYHTLKNQDTSCFSFHYETQNNWALQYSDCLCVVITTTMILWTAVISGVHIHSQYLSRQTHWYRFNAGLAHWKTYAK